MAQPVGVAGGPAPKPARPAKLAIPPILPAPRNMPVQAVTQAVSGNSGFSAQRPSSGSFSPAAIPQPQQSFGSKQASMQGLVKAIAKGTGTRPALPKPPDPHLWDVNPLSVGGWTMGRQDMGVDASAPIGAPILAPNDSVVKGVTPWGGAANGQPYELLQLTRGPNKGTYYYVAEQIDHIPPVGTTVPRGQPVARFAPTGTGIEMGFATPTLQQTRATAQGRSGETQNVPGNATLDGSQFISTFIHKGVKPGSVPQGSPPAAAKVYSGVITDTSGLTVKGQPLSPSQQAYANQVIATGKSLGASPQAITSVLAEAIAESSLGQGMGWDSGNPKYGGLLAGNVGTFGGLGGASSPAVTQAEIKAAFRGGQGYASGGAMGLARGNADPLQVAMTNSGSGSQFLGESGHASFAPEAAAMVKAATGKGTIVLPTGGYSGPSGGTAPVTSSGGAAPSAGTVAGFPAQTQQQANAAQMTAQISGLGSFPAGSTAQQRKMNLLSSFLKGQAGGANPFNAIGGGTSAGGMDLGSLALSSLQRLAGVTQLKVPGSRKKLF